MTREPMPARLVRGPGPAGGRLLCGARDYAGRYWCSGLIARVRLIGRRWEPYDAPAVLHRASGYIRDDAAPQALAIPVPFTRRCPDHPDKHLAIVDADLLGFA